MNKPETLQKVEFAKREIDAAATALEAAMQLVELAPRAQKVTISASLEQAFVRLRAAQRDLADLEALITAQT